MLGLRVGGYQLCPIFNVLRNTNGWLPKESPAAKQLLPSGFTQKTSNHQLSDLLSPSNFFSYRSGVPHFKTIVPGSRHIMAASLQIRVFPALVMLHVSWKESGACDNKSFLKSWWFDMGLLGLLHVTSDFERILNYKMGTTRRVE